MNPFVQRVKMNPQYFSHRSNFNKFINESIYNDAYYSELQRLMGYEK